MQSIWNVFVDGVYGPNALHEGLANGGPECASHSNVQFKALVNLCLLPYHMWVLSWGNSILQGDFKARQQKLGSRVKPSTIEKAMGYICLCNLLINIYLKIQTNTLVFMFNPCHVVNLFLVVVSLTSHCRLGELCALAVYSFSFGGYIGIIFNENEGFTPFETVIYHSEHAFASWLGPLVLSYEGRYDFRSYVKFPLPWFGFVLFTMYQRYVLMPVSQVTWANLNHALCGLDNDPFYKHFDLQEWYYLWADAYLLFSCMVGYLLNYVIQIMVFGVLRKEKVK